MQYAYGGVFDAEGRLYPLHCLSTEPIDVRWKPIWRTRASAFKSELARSVKDRECEAQRMRKQHSALRATAQGVS